MSSVARDVESTPNTVPIRLTIDDEAGFEAPQFDVVSGRLDMGLSEHFELRLVVQHTDPALHLKALLRRRVVARFEGEPYLSELRGIIRRARVLSTEPTGISRYELRIVPPIFLLHRRSNCRVFSHSTVPEILAILLDEHTASDSPTAPRLIDEHPMRPYTVQYHETDLRLVRRLLADEGIVFLFDFRHEGGQLVLMDDTARQAFSIPERLPFVPPAQLTTERPAIFSIKSSIQTTWTAAAIRDYDYLRPLLEIDGKRAASASAEEADLESYSFEVGEARSKAAADKRASDTLAAGVNFDRFIDCGSTVLLAPGTRFSIDGAVRPEGESELLVCWTGSTWESDGATGRILRRHSLGCIHATESFKARRLDKPRIHGVQTGVVVGGPGMEIDVDENGEVEVEFKWDRLAVHAAGVNRRVRISQGWAGPGYGLVTFPRVGDEVVVAYLDGDPDQPLIVGRVHNPTRPNPLRPKAQPTVSVWRSKSSPGGDGYNEILMDDLAGHERLDVHAQHDFNQVVEHDANVTVKHDHSVTVHGDHTAHTVGKGDISYADGFTFTTPAKGTLSATNLELNAHYLKVDAGDRDDITAGAYNHTAGGVFIHVTGSHETSCADFVVWATQSIRLQCGGSFIEIKPGGITIKSPGPVDINGAPINLNC